MNLEHLQVIWNSKGLILSLNSLDFWIRTKIRLVWARPPVRLITNLMDSFDINYDNKVLFGFNFYGPASFVHFCFLQPDGERSIWYYMILTMDKQKAFGLKSVPRATMTPWSIICLTGGCLSLTQWSEIENSIRKLHG